VIASATSTSLEGFGQLLTRSALPLILDEAKSLGALCNGEPHPEPGRWC
jgi:hypothetical protein